MENDVLEASWRWRTKQISVLGRGLPGTELKTYAPIRMCEWGEGSGTGPPL